MKRVLVVQGEHLLSDGISSLLVREGDLDVVNTTYVNGAALFEQMQQEKPSILILEENNGLGEISSIVKLLKDCQVFRMIIIDDQKNLIHIYEKKELAVARSADLITAIRA